MVTGFLITAFFWILNIRKFFGPIIERAEKAIYSKCDRPGNDYLWEHVYGEEASDGYEKHFVRITHLGRDNDLVNGRMRAIDTVRFDYQHHVNKGGNLLIVEEISETWQGKKINEYAQDEGKSFSEHKRILLLLSVVEKQNPDLRKKIILGSIIGWIIDWLKESLEETEGQPTDNNKDQSL